MTNPFEDPEATYLVLVNHEGQYSLWPSFAEVPAGWTVTVQAAGRQDALDRIAGLWTDMRPKSLVDAMNGTSA
ncbi:MbtH family protein [Streptomyces virginiae]|uniref:Putative MbtH-like protein n=1 Tax=Streptomyces virginiae TaxID=1961 RepID=G1UHX7_STRVG|nr:MbtH family protein [Streptomyces virginiae]BAK86403.1 putative MbtH-like protein [Streptomyces virginiae]